MLGADDDPDALLEPQHRAGPGDRVADVVQDATGVGGVPVVDEIDPTGVQRRYDTVARRAAQLDVERLPGAVLFVLGDAQAVLSGAALGRLVQLVGSHAEDVQDGEAHRPTDGRVGAEARPEDVAPRVEPELGADRTVHDQQGAAAGRALPGTRGRPALVDHRLERGQHHGQVLGPASRHGRADSDLAHRGRTPELGEADEDLVGIPVRLGEEPLDERGSGRDDRQTVGPALLVAVLDGLEQRVDVDRLLFGRLVDGHQSPGPAPPAGPRRISRT